jgi:tellurium resistance protein TerD
MVNSINLTKGGRIDLKKAAPSLTKVRVGLGWKANVTDTGFDFDLDATAFGLYYDAAGNPKLLDAENGADFMVFYGNKDSKDGAIHHSGDNRSGDGDGDDETVTVDLSKLDKRLTEISFIVSIYEAPERKQNFGQVPSSYVAIYDDATGATIARYDLGDDFSTETSVQMGSIYKRDDGNWGFKAIGAGYAKGLDSFVLAYGATVA